MRLQTVKTAHLTGWYGEHYDGASLRDEKHCRTGGSMTFATCTRPFC
jgi:hypothetical protein